MEKRIIIYISIWGSLIMANTVETKIGFILFITQAFASLCLYAYLIFKN